MGTPPGTLLLLEPLRTATQGVVAGAQGSRESSPQSPEERDQASLPRPETQAAGRDPSPPESCSHLTPQPPSSSSLGDSHDYHVLVFPSGIFCVYMCTYDHRNIPVLFPTPAAASGPVLHLALFPSLPVLEMASYAFSGAAGPFSQL